MPNHIDYIIEESKDYKKAYSLQLILFGNCWALFSV